MAVHKEVESLVGYHILVRSRRSRSESCVDGICKGDGPHDVTGQSGIRNGTIRVLWAAPTLVGLDCGNVAAPWIWSWVRSSQWIGIF